MNRILEVDLESERVVVAAGGDEPRRDTRRRGGRLLLRARPVEPAGLHDRRERRRELGRRPLPEERVHGQPRHRRARSCCPTASCSTLGGKAIDAGRRARPARRDRRLGGNARDRGRGDAPRRAPARRSSSRSSRRSPRSTRRATPSPRIVAAGILPAAMEIMDTLHDPGRGGGVPARATRKGQAPCCSSSSTASPRRSRRTRRRSRRSAATAGAFEIRTAQRRRRARAPLARPQGRVRRDGPRVARLLRPGRRRAADEAARRCCGGSTSCPASTASGSATSSTPATATSIRSCSTTRPSRARYERAKALADAILAACVDEGGSLTGEHGIGVDKACAMPSMFSERDLEAFDRAAPRVRPGRARQPGQGDPDARGSAARCRGRTARHPLEQLGVAERF